MNVQAAADDVLRATDAAERLPKPVEGLPPDLSSGYTLTEWECEQRVAAERRATVERIRATVDAEVPGRHLPTARDVQEWLHAILDAERDGRVMVKKFRYVVTLEAGHFIMARRFVEVVGTDSPDPARALILALRRWAIYDDTHLWQSDDVHFRVERVG